MALTSQQRGWCVLKFYKTNSVVTVQRAFKRKFNVDPPTNKSILKCTGISLKEDASVIRERDIQAGRRFWSKLLMASENPFCAAAGSQHAELAES
jgi:hypothetical protein